MGGRGRGFAVPKKSGACVSSVSPDQMRRFLLLTGSKASGAPATACSGRNLGPSKAQTRLTGGSQATCKRSADLGQRECTPWPAARLSLSPLRWAAAPRAAAGRQRVHHQPASHCMPDTARCCIGLWCTRSAGPGLY